MLVHLLIPAEISKLESAAKGRVDALWLEGSPSAAAEWLNMARRRPLAPKVYIRLGRFEAAIEEDLNELMPAAPDGIVLPLRNSAEVEHLSVKLAVREAELGIDDGATQIIGLIASPAAIFHLASFAISSPRLVALGFATDDFATALGASNLESSSIAVARDLTLLAAKAAGVAAFLIADQAENLAATYRAAKHDGFDGLVTSDIAAVAALRATLD